MTNNLLRLQPMDQWHATSPIQDGIDWELFDAPHGCKIVGRIAGAKAERRLTLDPMIHTSTGMAEAMADAVAEIRAELLPTPSEQVVDWAEVGP